MTALLYFLFVLSGAAGLFYESVWSRYLSLFVGHGAYAQVIVLVIFLGGMALGAVLVSRRSARLEDPLYGYAVIEVVVGLIGLVFHDLVYVPVTGWAYDSLFPALGGAAVGMAKWTLAGLLILPQSILLGATFPLMSAGIIRRAPDRPGSVLSILYFTNSLGAAAGVLLAGFVLVNLAGLPGTLLAAAIINLVVGLVAFFVAKLSPPPTEGEARPPEEVKARFERDANLVPPPQLTRLLLVVALATAAASFIYEIAWIRLLSLVLGSATHSFELMLSAFILGLSLGAFAVRRRMENITRPLAALAVIQVVMGAFAALSLVFYQQSFQWMATLLAAVGRTDPGYTLYTVARYALCLAIMLPATFCAGMTLPLITRTLFVQGAGERAIGRVYGWNTLGSIIGAGLASLLLLPLIGLKGTLLLGGALDMVLGLAILVTLLRAAAPVRPLAFSSLALSVGAILAIAIGVHLDRAVVTAGVFRSGRVARTGEVHFYKDGRTATVTIAGGQAGSPARTERVGIRTNGKPDGSLDPVWYRACVETDSLKTMSGDDPTQVLLPLVTLAHRPSARSIAIIGQGTGMTGHALLASPTPESVVTIEIEPVMVEASRFFYPANRRVFDDPRSRFIYDDAKSYFAASNRQFDIIVAEPSNPWVSGVSGLFTTEFYARLKRYLAPGAILGQWLHTYELSDDLVLTVLAALHQNFSDYRVYAVNVSDLLIVAVAEGAVPEPDWKVFDLPEVAKDLCHFHRPTPGDFEAMLLTTRPMLAPLLDGTRQVNSDFFPVLDLGAERTRFLRQSANGLNGLFDGAFDFSGLPAHRRLGPEDRTTSAFGTVPRISALLAGARVRRGEGPVDADTVWRESGSADSRAGMLRWLAGLRAGESPGEWSVWAREYSTAFTMWHQGTRGWVDTAFMNPVRAWLDRKGAPPQVRSAVTFREYVALGRYREALEPAQTLIAEARAGHHWVDQNFLREAAVIGFLAAGRPDDARTLIDSLPLRSGYDPNGVRNRLLVSLVAPRESDTP